jgi:anti-anti-sigma factor
MLFNAAGNQILLIRHLPEPTMNDHDSSLEGTRAVLRPGDLTSGTVEQVREKLKSLLKAGAQDLTVDLAGVQMVDSMGIGLLIQANNSLAKAGGGLTVTNASAELLDLFRSMRLDKRFTIQS